MNNIHKIINPNFRARIFTHPKPLVKKAFILTHLDGDDILFDFGDVRECVRTAINFSSQKNLNWEEQFLQIFDNSGRLLMNDYLC